MISAINGSIDMKFGTHMYKLIAGTLEKKILTQVHFWRRQGPFLAQKLRKIFFSENWPKISAGASRKIFFVHGH